MDFPPSKIVEHFTRRPLSGEVHVETHRFLMRIEENIKPDLPARGFLG